MLMTGLVLEGGTLRGIFSAGVMDALLEMDIMFPYIIGVSAGISNAASYISRQPGRNIEILEKYRSDRRYIGKRNVLHDRSIFGLDFVFDEIPNLLVPFDWDTFDSYTGTAYAGVTNADTGEAEYLNCLHTDRQSTILRATCALPGIMPPIKWNGKTYYDGGIADSIPIHKALSDGCDKNLIVLTQPRGFRKEYGKHYALIGKIIGGKYPKVVETMNRRHLVYNETLDFCEELERLGKAVIIAPTYALNSMEKDISALKANYWHGITLGKENEDRIRSLFL